jgi:hypothetical protein
MTENQITLAQLTLTTSRNCNPDSESRHAFVLKTVMLMGSMVVPINLFPLTVKANL